MNLTSAACVHHSTVDFYFIFLIHGFSTALFTLSPMLFRCQGLGKYGMICVEDLVQEVYSAGENFQHASSFLWPFELSAPPEGFKKWGYIGAGGDGGFRGEDINRLAMAMA